VSTEINAESAFQSRSRRAARIWFAALALAGLVAYFPTLYSLARSGSESDSYYTHWFLIPPVSAVLIWLKKDRLRHLPLQKCALGLPLAAGSLVMHIAAVWFRIDFVSAFALVVTVGGLALYLFGKRLVREIAFPLFYLVFMVPLPQLVINPLAFHMKVLSGKLAVWVYNLLGGTAILAGSKISFASGETLWMGYECSGLRSLIAMAALGAAFAYLVRTSGPRKVLLFLLSLPLAVLSNGLRVTSLCFAANKWGTGSKAFKVFHDTSSPVVFLIMLLGLFAVHKLLLIGGRRKEMEAARCGESGVGARVGPILSAISTRRLGTAFGLFALSAILVFLSPHAMFLTRWMSSLEPVELPERIGSWQKRSTEVVGSEGVWSMLNTKSIVLGTYREPEGNEMRVMVVASDTHRDAFHPPEICMMGGGGRVLKGWKEPIKVDSAGAKGLSLNAFVMRDTQHMDTLVLYWFMVGEKSMGSRLLQQLILLVNGARKVPITGAMIQVTASLAASSQQEALHSAKDLIASLVPQMPRILETAKRRKKDEHGD
jgi:EpsI family protein